MALRIGHNGWVIWLTLLVGLLLSVVPMPEFMEIGRPLWLAMLLTFWTLTLPHRVGLLTAWVMGIAEDVLYGSLLGQTALVQSFVLLVVYGIAQLLALWLNALAGSRPPTLVFLTPSLVSALLWPWIYLLLRGLRLRFGVN